MKKKRWRKFLLLVVAIFLFMTAYRYYKIWTLPGLPQPLDSMSEIIAEAPMPDGRKKGDQQVEKNIADVTPLRLLRTYIIDSDPLGAGESHVHVAAISPDNTKMLVGHGMGTMGPLGKSISLIDTKTGQTQWTLPKKLASAIGFFPDGKKWVALQSDYDDEFEKSIYKIIVGDTSTGQILRETSVGFSMQYGQLIVSEDGNTMTLINNDNYSNRWPSSLILDITGDEVKIKEKIEFENPIISQALSKDKTKLVAGDYNGHITFQDKTTGETLWKADIHRNSDRISDDVKFLGFLEGDSKVFSAGSFPIQIWDAQTGREIARQIVGPNDGETLHDGRLLSVSPDKKLLLTGFLRNAVRVWTAVPDETFPPFDLPGDELYRRNAKPNTLASAVFFANGDVMTCGTSQDDRSSYPKTIYKLSLFNAKTGQIIRTLDQSEDRQWGGVCFSPDRSMVLATGYSYPKHPGRFSNTQVLVWLFDARTGEVLRQFSAPSENIHVAAFFPDGKKIVTGSSEGYLRIYDVKTQRLLKRINLKHNVSGMVFSEDGKKILVGLQNMRLLPGRGLKVQRIGENNNAAILLDAKSGKKLMSFTGHESEIISVAISPDQSRILTASNDKTARLWDTATGKELHRFDNFLTPVNSIAFSHDGSMFAFGSGDGTASIRIHETSTGREIYHAHASQVHSLKFANNDQSLLIMSNYSGFMRKFIASMIDSTKHPVPDLKAVRAKREADNLARLKQMVNCPLESLDLVVELQKDSERAKNNPGLVQPQEKVNADMVIDLRKAAGRTGSIDNVFFSSDGGEVYVETLRFIHVFNAHNGQEKRRFKRNGYCSGFLPETNQMIFGLNPAGICELDTGKVVRQVTFKAQDGNEKELLHKEFPDMIKSRQNHAVSPDGTKELVKDQNGNLLLKSTTGNMVIHDFKIHPWTLNCAFAFSPDGKTVAANLSDGIVGFFNIEKYSEQ